MLSVVPISTSIRSTASLAPPCSGPVERRHRPRHGAVRVRAGAADHPHGGCRAVLLVVRVQDEEDVQRAHQSRGCLVLPPTDPEQHVQEVLGVGETVLRVHVRQPLVVPVGVGGQRGHLGQEPHDLGAPVLRIVDPPGLGVEGRQRRHRRDHHPHGVGVVAEAPQDGRDVLVHVGVMGDLVHEVVQLGPRGKFPVQDEVAHLEEGRLPGQLLDRVSAVLQYPLAALHVGDPAGGEGRVGEAGVVGHHPEVAVVDLDPAQVQGADDVAVQDVDFIPPSGAVVGDAEGVSGVAVGHWVSGAGGVPGARAGS